MHASIHAYPFSPLRCAYSTPKPCLERQPYDRQRDRDRYDGAMQNDTSEQAKERNGINCAGCHCLWSKPKHSSAYPSTVTLYPRLSRVEYKLSTGSPDARISLPISYPIGGFRLSSSSRMTISFVYLAPTRHFLETFIGNRVRLYSLCTHRVVQGTRVARPYSAALLFSTRGAPVHLHAAQTRCHLRASRRPDSAYCTGAGEEARGIVRACISAGRAKKVSVKRLDSRSTFSFCRTKPRPTKH